MVNENFEIVENLDSILEAILFVAGEGVETEFLAEKLNVTMKELTDAVEKLKKRYSGNSGIHLIKYKNKIQFSSNPGYSGQIADALNPIKERQLSKATLEALSIIAYKQPITRLEVEEIRGVNSDYAMEVLEKHSLIEVVGRKDSIGKPLLFGTTEEFLKRFDLTSLAELPDYEELLSRIKTIETGDNKETDSLFNYPTEEVPDFLKDEENLQKVEG